MDATSLAAFPIEFGTARDTPTRDRRDLRQPDHHQPHERQHDLVRRDRGQRAVRRNRACPDPTTSDGTRSDRGQRSDRRERGGADGDAGMVTVESAVALCAFVAVLALLLAGLSAVLDQIRCTDAAREAARLVARNEPDQARQAATAIAPAGATITVHTDADTVTVVVTAAPGGGLLPGVKVRGEAFAVVEPSGPDATDDLAATSSLASANGLASVDSSSDDAADGLRTSAADSPSVADDRRATAGDTSRPAAIGAAAARAAPLSLVRSPRRLPVSPSGSLTCAQLGHRWRTVHRLWSGGQREVRHGER